MRQELRWNSASFVSWVNSASLKVNERVWPQLQFRSRSGYWSQWTLSQSPKRDRQKQRDNIHFAAHNVNFVHHKVKMVHYNGPISFALSCFCRYCWIHVQVLMPDCTYISGLACNYPTDCLDWLFHARMGTRRAN